MPVSTTDTLYTSQVRELISSFYNEKGDIPSVVTDAMEFFAQYREQLSHKKSLLEALDSADTEDEKTFVSQALQNLERAIETARSVRVHRIEQFALQLLALSEGDSESETHTASAKLLGTLLLITAGNQGKFARQHKKLKPIYKAVLSLRLADALFKEGNVKHSYLQVHQQSSTRFSGNAYWRAKWQREIAIPLIKAALLQDIGLYHPDAQSVLLGPEQNKDEFRLLAEDERKQLLKLNLQHSLFYVKNGIGLPTDTSSSEDESTAPSHAEKQALNFALEVIQDATILKNHVGDLIKIPQIYASFVLSTKSDYSRKDLPKAYMVIKSLIEKGQLNKRIATNFLHMVGYFPQGFGITYIATDMQGNIKDGYEYAIVNRLFPENPAEPRVRTVSRNLNFIVSGKNTVISRDHNLYFLSNTKKIQRIDKARLQELVSSLSSDGAQSNVENLVPQYWEPHDFFADKKHQNLWTTNQ
ncbi:hypothetical protein QTP81_14225 [Alteromonas sp. ASW11-36]|uniref:Uncharacterized protein n=1 Tax=Alteromonas arenosi TaxID=3055817 RepID=A0ABT7T000_9ALTE|nr:hypothetical protein [Alteromonas sp. ASW11-36]MDM7861755.1 hypothetical protein [Alteromonas sp. ASW11-36]